MQKYLSKCLYDEEKEPYCPNFRLGYIADQARENFSELCRTVSISSDFKNVYIVDKCLFIHISIMHNSASVALLKM